MNPWVKKYWIPLNFGFIILFVLLISLGKFVPALNVIGFAGLILQIIIALVLRRKIYPK